MHALTLPMPWRSVTNPLLAALACAMPLVAAADEPSPYYIGASEVLTHDSNVFRTPGGVSDSFSSTGLRGGFDQTISRQRFHASATLNYDKYRNRTELDNTSYGINAGWDWASVEKLSGNLAIAANQSLATFNGNASVPISTRNLIKTDQVSGNVQWGGEGLLSAYGSYAHSRVRYSAHEYLPSQSDADVGSLGINYKLGADLRAGSALRLTRTDSPYAIPTVINPTQPSDYRGNTSNGRNLDLTLDWRAGALTNVNARASWTHQTNSAESGLNFSGLTGSLGASYAPTAKLSFNASITRDAGTNSSLINTPVFGSATAVSGLSENSQTSDTFALGVTYAATAKINVNAGIQYRRAKIVNSVSIVGVTVGTYSDDDNNSATLGVNYAISRSVQLGCNAVHESRRVSGVSNFSYDDNTISCSAQLTLR